MSNIRNWVQASKFYEIGGLSDVTPDNEGDLGERTADGPAYRSVDDNIKKFLQAAKADKPINVTRKND